MKIAILYIPAVCVVISLCISPDMDQDDRSVASVNGTYSTPLSNLSVPDDYERYGDFCDCCYRSGSWYVGYDNVSVGYRVFVYPYLGK